MGPQSNDTHWICETPTHREDDVETEMKAEFGVTCLQAKEPWQPPEAGKRPGMDPPSEPPGACSAVPGFLILASRTVSDSTSAVLSPSFLVKRRVEALLGKLAKATQQLSAEPGLAVGSLCVVRTMSKGAAGEACHQV